MKKSIIPIAVLLCLFFSFSMHGQSLKILKGKEQTTICNPLNLNYRFCLDNPSRREAADPTIINFKDEYYLFVSKSGGYWHSNDLINWDLITTKDLPLEDYAPTAVVIRDSVFFMASSDKPVVYKTADPKSGKWFVANPAFSIGMTDPCFFLDDDGRLYFYYGCSNINPIYGVELDPQTFNPIGKPQELFNSHKDKYGWERAGDYNEREANPWIEGAWMTKHNGKYYIQYAGPGTEYKSYCDGLYVSDKPLGEYTLASHNPCSYKPEGFIASAGHSSTMKDKYGNYWHVSTMTISQKHMFERRLGLFPMFFDKDGALYAYTRFGDFPYKIPKKKISGPEELSTNWMLLSYKKPVEVSSEIAEHPKNYLSDETVRTYWSAKTGDKGEWIKIDLQKEYSVNAVQINFAENETKIFGRTPGIFYQYLLEYSVDNKTWKTLSDKTNNELDVPHDYLELKSPIKARSIRLTNYRMPSGTFAVADLRVFGKGKGKLPLQVDNLNIDRSKEDRCIVNLNWKKNSDATGYNVRFGTQKDKLYNTYQVLGNNSVTIRSLNSLSKYYFSVEAFNENGTSKISKVYEVQ
jgi:xylan 1,4-beta-xylosidase